MQAQSNNLDELLDEFEQSKLISEPSKNRILTSKVLGREPDKFNQTFLFELINVYIGEVISPDDPGAENISIYGMIGNGEEMKKVLQKKDGNSLKISQILIDYKVIPNQLHQEWFF